MFNFFKKTALNRLIFFALADVIIIALSVWLSFMLRFDGVIPEQYFPFIYRMIFLAIVFILPIFYFHRLYSFSWSYVSTNEAVSLFRAVTVSFIFLGIAIFISNYFPHFINFPRSIIFVSYFLVFIMCGALRFSKRIYLVIFRKGVSSKKDNTLIVGAGDAGEQISRSINLSADSPYNLCGFIDDNPVKKGVIIHGLKVFGKISDIPQIVREKNIEQLIIALPSVNSRVIKTAVELGRKANIRKIKIAPILSEIIKGKISFRNLKDIDVEDLLNREKVVIDTKSIFNFIKGKKILITGAAGSIGSELCRQVAEFDPSYLFLVDQDETSIFNISKELSDSFPELKFQSLIADVRDKEKINNIFKKLAPQIIFHAAAYKHVPLMEENPDEAVKNNIFGTKNLVELSIDNGVEKFIFISTDKAVNPTSVMGASKRMGEMICQTFNKKNKTKFLSVRFGNVLDSRGSVIPAFKEQIKKGGPVQVTHPDMKRYFMLTSEACLLVMQAGAMGNGGEVFVLDMGKPIKIIDLAREMIKLSGLKPDEDIAVVFTSPRPGEKMFEEILTAEEGTIATQSDKIFMAKLSDVNQNRVEDALSRLETAISNNDNNEIIKIFKDIIPHFSNFVLLYKK
jgi:FlaA1/EpsC-like NDP-sugar epimerase